jgi:general stress protein 26
MQQDRGSVDKLWSMIKGIEVAMLTTVDEDGTLRSRPMWVQQQDFDGDLWFFTRAGSPKVFEVGKHRQVGLTFAEPKRQDYVSVSGAADLLRDREKARELWSEWLKTWFPQGLDDPDLALLRVRVEKAEYWDAPSSTMVHLYGYVKSRVTGEPPQPGDAAKVALR